MPQYFFHVTDGHSRYRDEEGSLHLSFADACAEASRIAGELARDGADPAFIVCVVDHDGNEIARVPLEVNRTDPATEMVAKKIIELAKQGERDPVRLRERVIEAVSSRPPSVAPASTVMT